KINTIINTIMRIIVIAQQKTNRVLYVDHSNRLYNRLEIRIVLCICLLKLNNDNNNIQTNKKLVS
ncbi:MAG: hypothetical protein ACJ71K_13235, partial [Nitrososphaeraceae archaeon]